MSTSGVSAARVAFDAGRDAFGGGDLLTASCEFSAALAADPGFVLACCYLGTIAVQLGRMQAAIVQFERACELEPGQARHHFEAALVYRAAGEQAMALAHCRKALELTPDLEPAYQLQAELVLPGPSYLDVISRSHAWLQPRTYLEIGVEVGSSIVLASPLTQVIGIDPAPQVNRPLGDNVRIHAATSDAFFRTTDVIAEFGGRTVDLAFIDGMHQFEYALRDFANVERCCSPRSTVLIHDCFPLSRLTAERQRQTKFWSGDVWRLVLALRKYRPDLELHVIAAAPTGLCIVRRLDPGSRLLPDRMDDIVQEFLAVDYSVLDDDKAELLCLHPNEWDSIRELLQD